MRTSIIKTQTEIAFNLQTSEGRKAYKQYVDECWERSDDRYHQLIEMRARNKRSIRDEYKRNKLIKQLLKG